jgi:prepilin-type N-terminal cleavage/methylation domain-containing protein
MGYYQLDDARNMIRHRPHISDRGFSVVELIIAITIFTILSSFLLANYNKSGRRINVNTLAHQIAQYTRDAQVSAMSVKPTKFSSNEFPGYGLHFETASTGFVYFSDRVTVNGRYDAGTGSCGTINTECEQYVELDRGYQVISLCAGSSNLACGANAQVDIVFTRPNPDAAIWGNVSGAAQSMAGITVGVPSFYSRQVQVWLTGQISVQ